ncbi:MAG: tRNA (5-methylaminomethyl-2-thiouridine)(34)-methyltransferase MnmD [Betaproteobacteria bacterium]|nr:tRNA (5-methylaminomethyl-2-thiouridine)(34)-methyltransferase MnmD [Betaproteobacteria bacterium]
MSHDNITTNAPAPNQPAVLDWQNQQPYSAEYQDVYFSTENGLLETEYVFLQGNDLRQRWQQPDLQSFTIIETGFGTGLNFLCTLKLWLATAPPQAILHFISTEKHPLTLHDISCALTLWPELSNYNTELLAQYSCLLDGKCIALYNHRVRLSLLIGDATEQLTQAQHRADAWFLDGFSPAKNPDMWQPALFEQMARLSHPATTLATFTSAGFVRRGLTVAGFLVKKRTGFGKKREMICGQYAGAKNDS